MATALDLGGAEKPEHIEFMSVIPHINGKGKVRDTMYGAYMNVQRMVSTSQYKLISYPKIEVELLFDLEKDPEEMKNLATNPEYTKVLKEMRGRLDAQMKAFGDPLLEK